MGNVKVAGSSNGTRVFFFDNLRCFFVLCVVLQHAANAYNGMSWWPVAEETSSMVVGWLSAFFDAFTMPLLFYVAGYFAVPTMRKKGGAEFFDHIIAGTFYIPGRQVLEPAHARQSQSGIKFV